MDWEIISPHPDFRLNGIKCSVHDLQEIGYSLIKEGEEFEQQIGDFLIDWLSDDDFVIVRTSGSTGPPKRVFLKKSTLAHSANATGDYLNLGEGSKALLCLSASNIAGKMMLVRALLLGWQLDYIAPSKSPLSGLNKSYDFCSMVPLQVSGSIGALSSIKTLLIGGAPIYENIKSDLQDLSTRAFESYGMTETASHIALKPLNKAAIRSVNGEAGWFSTTEGVSVSKDERGCLVIHADYISEMPIITNDFAELAGSDKFRWLGRRDHVINSGGIKLIPEQIEKRIFGLFEDRFILTAVPDPELGERLVLVIEGPVNEKLNLKNIKMSAGLKNYEIPKEIYFVDQFPETNTGKIKRSDVTQMILGDT